MATYSDWNDAVADFFAHRTPPGGMFHLSVDEDALVEIAESSELRIRQPNAVDDFKRAVRVQCVRHERVRLPTVRRSRKTNAPRGLAFLAAMSLAAHRMAPDDNVGENNYFTRLREILGLTDGAGRPNGMTPAGVEESLWTALNGWARENGWRPSAERGYAVSTRFINYPLSQALLRDGDKGRIESAFRQSESRLTRYADRERVAAWFFNNDAGLSTNHLTNLARDSERFDSVVDAVYDVYDSIDWDSPPDESGTPSRRRARSKTLLAGLYRNAPLFGPVSYLLYPRGRAQNVSGLSAIREDGASEQLHQDGGGGFLPLWEVDPAGDMAWQVTGNDAVSELRLPSRDFWVLTRDRFDSGYGDFASRGAPQFGETFILLCKDGMANEMRALRRNGLVEWEGDPEKVLDGWVEFRECKTRSPNWSSSVAGSDLSNELRPQYRASISLQGGLKAAGRDSWIEGYAPTYSVASLDNCQARVFSASRIDADPIVDDDRAPNLSPTALPDLEPDDYWLEILVNENRADKRFFKIVAWNSLTSAKPANPFGTRIGNAVLRGALLVSDDGAADR